MQPSTSSTVASGYKGNSPVAYKLAKSWQEEADLARSCLNRATKRMKKWADKKRRHVEYSVGDLVLAKLHNILRHKDGLSESEASWEPAEDLWHAEDATRASPE
ncbi:hypothetical protein CRG98_010690 [Punica granatum]|uniref:Chromo domain-containing protein n=1 Tax=Punica granatum TaxID=22663 RepID=A0A2I0KKA8_PUNGR|nr:hypothetical protein CRG98_010690 [Punica granatum]